MLNELLMKEGYIIIPDNIIRINFSMTFPPFLIVRSTRLQIKELIIVELFTNVNYLQM